jgi:hypothetical protein
VKNGEIVRTPAGSIARFNALSAHPLDFPEDSLEVITVAEMHKAAGCPIPKGCIYALATGTLAAFREINPDDCGNRRAHRFLLESIVTADGVKHDWVQDGTWNPERMIDLSRLPALDAWEHLSEFVKAVVK